mmetsp:Transcript_12224/g.27688  ORF Transcript_12224/g.27688 Transcript_12224/m.27688 type:complete len:209 (-) Transcript_12224:1253-1879(-)
MASALRSCLACCLPEGSGFSTAPTWRVCSHFSKFHRRWFGAQVIVHFKVIEERCPQDPQGSMCRGHLIQWGERWRAELSGRRLSLVGMRTLAQLRLLLLLCALQHIRPALQRKSSAVAGIGLLVGCTLHVKMHRWHLFVQVLILSEPHLTIIQDCLENLSLARQLELPWHNAILLHRHLGHRVLGALQSCIIGRTSLPFVTERSEQLN